MESLIRGLRSRRGLVARIRRIFIVWRLTSFCENKDEHPWYERSLIDALISNSPKVAEILCAYDALVFSGLLRRLPPLVTQAQCGFHGSELPGVELRKPLPPYLEKLTTLSLSTRTREFDYPDLSLGILQICPFLPNIVTLELAIPATKRRAGTIPSDAISLPRSPSTTMMPSLSRSRTSASPAITRTLRTALRSLFSKSRPSAAGTADSLGSGTYGSIAARHPRAASPV